MNESNGLLRGIGDSFTKKKVIKFHLESEPKMCYSLNNNIMRTGRRLFKRKQKKGVYTWKQCSDATGTLCNNYTMRVEQFHWKK